MSAFKKTVLFLHRWLGFISGLAVFIVSITGCIYCFQDDLQDVFSPHRKVGIRENDFLKPATLIAMAKKTYPKGKVTLILYYGPGRSAQVRMQVNKKSLSLFYNPYNGALLHVEDLEQNFFAFIRKTHLYLMLPKTIGKMVNGVCVIVFVIILISGLVLWWPKRKSDRKRSFKIKWGSRWRRINYDLHNVLGFYITFFAIILAITGLSYSFAWMRGGIYLAANLGKVEHSELKVSKSDPLQANQYPDSVQAINKVYSYVRGKSPLAQYLLLTPGSKPTSPITVSAYPKPLHFSYGDNYAFDRYSAKLLNFKSYQSKSLGAKVNALNYDIHTGQILGFFGKIIAFLVSLVSATLPITGVIIYFSKKKNSLFRKAVN